MDDAVTIFTLFKTLTDKLGITQVWLTATATNVMTLVGIVKPKFQQLDGFWPTTALVAVAAGLLAGAEFYMTPWKVFVCVLFVWGGTTVLMKSGEGVIHITRKGFNRGPSTPTDVKPGE